MTNRILKTRTYTMPDDRHAKAQALANRLYGGNISRLFSELVQAAEIVEDGDQPVVNYKPLNLLRGNHRTKQVREMVKRMDKTGKLGR